MYICRRPASYGGGGSAAPLLRLPIPSSTLPARHRCRRFPIGAPHLFPPAVAVGVARRQRGERRPSTIVLAAAPPCPSSPRRLLRAPATGRRRERTITPPPIGRVTSRRASHRGLPAAAGGDRPGIAPPLVSSSSSSPSGVAAALPLPSLAPPPPFADSPVATGRTGLVALSPSAGRPGVPPIAVAAPLSMSTFAALLPRRWHRTLIVAPLSSVIDRPSSLTAPMPSLQRLPCRCGAFLLLTTTGPSSSGRSSR